MTKLEQLISLLVQFQSLRPTSSASAPPPLLSGPLLGQGKCPGDLQLETGGERGRKRRTCTIDRIRRKMCLENRSPPNMNWPNKFVAASRKKVVLRFFHSLRVRLVCFSYRRIMPTWLGIVLGPVTRRKSRDEIETAGHETRRDTRRSRPICLETKTHETRQDARPSNIRSKFSLKILTQMLIFWSIFFFETDFFLLGGLARRSHEIETVSSRLV